MTTVIAAGRSSSDRAWNGKRVLLTIVMFLVWLFSILSLFATSAPMGVTAAYRIMLGLDMPLYFRMVLRLVELGYWLWWLVGLVLIGLTVFPLTRLRGASWKWFRDASLVTLSAAGIFSILLFTASWAVHRRLPGLIGRYQQEHPADEIAIPAAGPRHELRVKVHEVRSRLRFSGEVACTVRGEVVSALEGGLRRGDQVRAHLNPGDAAGLQVGREYVLENNWGPAAAKKAIRISTPQDDPDRL